MMINDFIHSCFLLSFFFFLSFFLHLAFTSQKVGYAHAGLTTQMPMRQMPVAGAQTMDQNTRHIRGLTFMNLWSSECEGHRKRQYRTEHKPHTFSTRIEIEISDSAGNRTWATNLEDREGTDHAIVIDLIFSYTAINLFVDFFLFKMSFYVHCNTSSVFCPRAGPSLQTQAPRLQFYPKAGLPLQTQEPKLKFYWRWIGAVASRCFPHTTLPLASKQTLKYKKRSQGHQRGSEESGFG